MLVLLVYSTLHEYATDTPLNRDRTQRLTIYCFVQRAEFHLLPARMKSQKMQELCKYVLNCMNRQGGQQQNSKYSFFYVEVKITM